MLLLDGSFGEKQISPSFVEPVNIPKKFCANDLFQFTLRVSGDSIATREIDSLFCSQDTTINVQVAKITTSSIGENGGTLKMSGFQLIVPPGAFEGEHILSVYRSYEENPFGSNIVSAMFQIDGLPDQFLQPISIEIQYHGSLANQSYLAAGVPGYTLMSNEPITLYDFFDATEHDGILTAQLAAGGKKSNSDKHTGVDRIRHTDKKNSLKLTMVTDYMLPVTTAHFKIYSPYLYLNYITEIANLIETQYEKLHSLGILFSNDELPFLIVIRNMDSSHFALCYFGTNLSTEDPSKWRIGINSSKLTTEMLPDIMSEAGVMLLGYKAFYDKVLTKFEDMWFGNMILTWSEGFFSLKPDFNYPQPFKGNETQFLNGIIPSNQLTKEELWAHGNGMSSFLEFLTDDNLFGNSIVGNMFNKVKNGKSATQAFIESVPTLNQSIWTQFCREYTSGEIYQVKSTVFQQNLSQEAFDVNKDGPHTRVFHDFYIDLSARFYQVNFNYPDIDSIIVSVDAANVSPLIFGLKYDDTVNYIEGQRIGNVSNLIANGYDQLLVVVTNNNMTGPQYRGVTEVNTTVQVIKKKSGYLDLPNCRIKIFVEGHYDGTGGSYTSTHTTFWAASGTWNDTVFTATIDEWVTSEDHKTGTIEVKVNSQTGEVISFYGEQTTTNENSGGVLVFTCQGTGPLPLTYDAREWGEPYIVYSVSGNDILSVLENFTYSNSVGTSNDYLVSYSVHEDSRVAIEFDNYN